MKITAEFNSNEELLSFINTFNTKGFIPAQGATIPVTPKKDPKPAAEVTKVETLKEADKKETPSNDVPWEDKKEEPKVEDTKKDEETKVTKEMVRAIFTTLIKAGKQADAKALTSKYGAKKVPDIKEEDYAAIFNEANALLEA